MNDELKDLLKRVKHAKEILGMQGYDHAYRANKVLEVVADRLRHLCKVTEAEFEPTEELTNVSKGAKP